MIVVTFAVFVAGSVDGGMHAHARDGARERVRAGVSGHRERYGVGEEIAVLVEIVAAFGVVEAVAVVAVVVAAVVTAVVACVVAVTVVVIVAEVVAVVSAVAAGVVGGTVGRSVGAGDKVGCGGDANIVVCTGVV